MPTLNIVVFAGDYCGPEVFFKLITPPASLTAQGHLLPQDGFSCVRSFTLTVRYAMIGDGGSSEDPESGGEVLKRDGRCRSEV